MSNDGFVLGKNRGYGNLYASLYYEGNTVLGVSFDAKDGEGGQDLGNGPKVPDLDRVVLFDSEGGFYGGIPKEDFIKALKEMAAWLEGVK